MWDFIIETDEEFRGMLVRKGQKILSCAKLLNYFFHGKFDKIISLRTNLGTGNYAQHYNIK